MSSKAVFGWTCSVFVFVAATSLYTGQYALAAFELGCAAIQFYTYRQQVGR